MIGEVMGMEEGRWREDDLSLLLLFKVTQLNLGLASVCSKLLLRPKFLYAR